ncbi:MAG: hypothetical protein QOF71_210 [Candidatus Eremiobacteraeota bacterium]|jgi:hypothetical protein|nr:hypothetical protein [Candidatus Eremiobacteraeota bacterium]
MRTTLALFAAIVLVACGGGGGGGGTIAPNPQPVVTPAPQNNSVTPTFTLSFAKSGSSAQRNPRYVNGVATLSVKITLVSNNGTPASGSGTTIIADVNGTSGTPCNPTCTLPGPASPPGTDRYTVRTYDQTGGNGNLLSTATKDFVLVAGAANAGLTITLNGVVKHFSLGSTTAPNAGTTPADVPLVVNVLDADSGTITGNYGDTSLGGPGTPVSVTIDETNPNGATLVAVGGATQVSQYSVTLHSDADSVKFHYGGLAENVRTITVSATGATNATTTFQPTLLPISPVSGTQIDLYVDSTTGGPGSSGGQTFTEPGFTGAPYSQNFSFTFTPSPTYTTPCDQIATISESPAGVFTATAPAKAKPPKAGICDLTINDNLSQAGHTSTATTKVSYTTSSFGPNSKRRR